MDKRAFAEYVIENVRELPPSAIIGKEIHLQRRGIHHLGLCPFHNDTKLGSFVVTDKKGIFKCFTCDTAGDNIKFVSLYRGISYLQSAFDIALECNIITNDEYEEYFGRRRYSEKQIQAIEKKYIEKDKEKFVSKKADDAILDKVYRIFIDNTTLYTDEDVENQIEKEIERLEKNIANGDEIAKTKLQKFDKNDYRKHPNNRMLTINDYNYLKKERKLSDKEIEENAFFSMPKKFKYYTFRKELEEEFGEDYEEIIKTIPGFFKEIKKDYFNFAKQQGIGFAIKNNRGQIVGIQIRRTVQSSTGLRYVWFSSSFAEMDDEKYEYGTGSGSPVDVVIPDVIKYPTIGITEGKFKALKMAKEYNMIVLSVQGVSSWRGILKELNGLKDNFEVTKKYGKPFNIKYITLAFDADMSGNMQVYTQLKNLSDELEKNKYKTYYLNWDETLGKGIDDLIDNGNKNFIKKYRKLQFDNKYNEMIKFCMEREGIKNPIDIDKDTLIKYYNYFFQESNYCVK